METSKLLELYSKPFAPSLKEGEYTVTLKSVQLVQNEKNPTNDYVKFEFVTKDTNRRIVENRFEKGFAIAISHLRQQLNRSNEEIVPSAFLKELVDNKTELKLYVTKVMINGIQKTNIGFVPPIKTEAATEITNDEQI